MKSYSMLTVGPTQGTDYQINDKNRSYPLPNLGLSGYQGVGIYWVDDMGTGSDWEAPGYRTSVVQDVSGTILLAENTHGQQCAGNIWSCICIAPYVSSSAAQSDDLYQTDNNWTQQDPTSTDSVNQGNLIYRAQRNRFNYVFCDGHVQTLPIQETIGSGTLTAPKGMWTQAAGD